jgi:hypothetical protein
VAVLKNWQHFSCEVKIAARGNFRLQLHDDDENARLIHEDFVIRVWFRQDSLGIPWTNIFNGIVKTPTRVWYSNGNKLSIFYGSDSNEFIDKALIMYPTSSPKSGKAGVASAVMSEYVSENIGSQATTANGRIIDHVNPIVINAPNPPVGPVWEGNKAYARLLQALQDIRRLSHERSKRVDFNVVYLGDFKWQVDIGKIFVDRTVNGLDVSTGLNGAGNAPIILSALYGNVKQQSEAIARVQEANVVIALGKKIGDDREVVFAQDIISKTVSPIAQREAMGQTQNQTNLSDFVLAELNERVGKKTVLIEPKFTKAFALFKDLWPGDFFTVVSVDGEQINKQLIKLKMKIQQTFGGSTIQTYTLFTETREP